MRVFSGGADNEPPRLFHFLSKPVIHRVSPKEIIMLYVCNGNWLTHEEPIENVVIGENHDECVAYVMSGFHSDVYELDTDVFWCTNGKPIVGNHGEFQITTAKEIQS
jgi:hypothetical protein